MLVRDVMTPHPLTAPPDLTVLGAYRLMQERSLRHLPILEDGRLVGIVSDRDLSARASVLATPEQRRGLEDPLRSVMVSPVVTTDLEEPVEEAARRMRERRIGSLVVTDESGAVRGIVTGIDLLGAIIRLTGVNAASSRLELEVDNVPGQLARVGQALEREGVNVSSVLTSPAPEGRLRFVLRVDTPLGRPLARRLAEQGFEVVWPPMR
ncbi:acetoin utilization protein AcuB [Deinobacterium chartae]|uniref:Acetoin utilization protein AcuB n=1 Tax=Deinobacterium chartae TaxID=521158 RepID=A0A841I6F7_9DEIO|nr:CBS domain-containing protein [Deinobacterium chartae]MBB6099425.1 acetoin utilization protein AcuB [Deinobacterium chartae]